MAEYNFAEIEKKWQNFWEKNETFKAEADTSRKKYYVMDMFPYPSGAGLHVGHPLGYIATDIVARYKRSKGFNVMHPMGFDAFGLPAEQYAIQTGQHPAITTEANIERYKEQLRNIGFSFDWDKEVQTCDPKYYKWTQWIFIQLFNGWYNNETRKAHHIDDLVQIFSTDGNGSVDASCDENVSAFTADEWNGMSEKSQQAILSKYRLTYLSETTVNWCPELGTVLSNDEVKDGFSERGGYPVVRKKMKQWSMRITAYAERLLQGLDEIDWSEPMKEMQRNWIGKSTGVEMEVCVHDSSRTFEVFTTRIDTIYGLTFFVLAPEHDLVDQITTSEQKAIVEEYVEKAKNRSERDRMTHAKNVSGVFTGAYAIHPFTNEKLPIWTADYVLAGYGTGAVMAVPGGDQRDYEFARHFKLPIVAIYENTDITKEANPTKEGKIINEGILKGLTYQAAIEKAIAHLEEKGIGSARINYRIRDAIFARQRYWGEPVPIYFKDDIPYPVDLADLPIILPEVDKYLPTEDGDPPLGRAQDFTYQPGGSNQKYPLELSTMPGWAGSSWYWYRYMDAHNEDAFVDPKKQEYWRDVDLYIGGTEHATGHLLYSRFWNHFLYDMGYVSEKEPFKKLVNQGMIQGRSSLAYRIKGTNKFVSYNLKDQYETSRLHVDVNMVRNDELDIEAFKQWRPDLNDSEFILEDGKFICGVEIEKMSKRLYNVVNPDDIVQQYGADTLRLYEMFLGPLEQFKPWNTHGIDGVFKFLRKFWRLFHDENGEFIISDEQPTEQEQKIIHKAIKKTQDDIDRLSLNTAVSLFMITVNDLTSLKCNKREILENLTVIISPFAPHLCEELWEKLGHAGGISAAAFPDFEEKYLKEDSYEYPVSVNGKVRAKMSFGVDLPRGEIENAVLASDVIKKWTNGNNPKKVIIVPKKIINIVI